MILLNLVGLSLQGQLGEIGRAGIMPCGAAHSIEDRSDRSHTEETTLPFNKELHYSDEATSPLTGL